MMIRKLFCLLAGSLLLSHCRPSSTSQNAKQNAVQTEEKAAEPTSAAASRTSNEETLEQRARTTLQALGAMDTDKLQHLIHPSKGVRFSPYATVDTDTDILIPAAMVEQALTQIKPLTWGYFDATGEEIRLLPVEYFDRFVYDADYLKAEKTGWNERIGLGNSIHNIPDVYPDGQFVEYHFSGFNEQYGGLDWKSLRLIFEEHEGSWYLVGVVHDQWTS